MQIMKKIVLSILRLVKENLKISMKRIRFELSLDYENEVEEILAMLDIDSIKQALESNGSSPKKQSISSYFSTSTGRCWLD